MTIYIPSYKWWRDRACTPHPADHCCSCFTCNDGWCCRCCDLRQSVLACALWQVIAGALTASLYTVLAVLNLRNPDEAWEENPLVYVLLVYEMAHWWLYFVSGVIGVLAALDTQGIHTYEQRVIVMSRVYAILCIFCVTAHFNLILASSGIFTFDLAILYAIISVGPIIIDVYILFLAWSFHKKMCEQKRGLFRGKPIMHNQAKPEQLVDMHDAHHLMLSPPHDQIIQPLRQQPPGDPSLVGTNRSFRVPLDGASFAHSEDTSAVWNLRDSSASSLASSAAVQLQLPGGRPRAASIDGGDGRSAAAPHSAEEARAAAAGPDGGKPLHAIEEEEIGHSPPPPAAAAAGAFKFEARTHWERATQHLNFNSGPASGASTPRKQGAAAAAAGPSMFSVVQRVQSQSKSMTLPAAPMLSMLQLRHAPSARHPASARRAFLTKQQSLGKGAARGASLEEAHTPEPSPLAGPAHGQGQGHVAMEIQPDLQTAASMPLPNAGHLNPPRTQWPAAVQLRQLATTKHSPAQEQQQQQEQTPNAGGPRADMGTPFAALKHQVLPPPLPAHMAAAPASLQVPPRPPSPSHQRLPPRFAGGFSAVLEQLRMTSAPPQQAPLQAPAALHEHLHPAAAHQAPPPQQPLQHGLHPPALAQQGAAAPRAEHLRTPFATHVLPALAPEGFGRHAAASAAKKGAEQAKRQQQLQQQLQQLQQQPLQAQVHLHLQSQPRAAAFQRSRSDMRGVSAAAAVAAMAAAQRPQDAALQHSPATTPTGSAAAVSTGRPRPLPGREAEPGPGGALPQVHRLGGGWGGLVTAASLGNLQMGLSGETGSTDAQQQNATTRTHTAAPAANPWRAAQTASVTLGRMLARSAASVQQMGAGLSTVPSLARAASQGGTASALATAGDAVGRPQRPQAAAAAAAAAGSPDAPAHAAAAGVQDTASDLDNTASGGGGAPSNPASGPVRRDRIVFEWLQESFKAGSAPAPTGAGL